MRRTNKTDYVGMKFGRLTIVKPLGRGENRIKRSLCQCECGNTVVKATIDVVRGHVKSCGCLAREVKARRSYKHGLKGERIYACWLAMHSRCEKPQNRSYKNYGGRGIRVCNEWSDAIRFKEWAMKNGYRDDLQIERINNDGNYEPSNCRWATPIEQANNKRTSKLVEINGETKTAAEWARTVGISYSSILNRLRRGWCGADLISPMRRYPRND